LRLDDYTIPKYLQLQINHLPVYRPDGRRLGVVFEDLTVTGVAAEENTVTDFAQVLENIVTLPYQAVRLFAGRRQGNVRNLIQNVSGLVRPGETLLVLGTPGAGCSTTLRAIASDIESFVSVHGQVEYSTISSKEARKYYKSEIVYNNEEDNHFPKLSVGNTIDYALELRKPVKDEQTRKDFKDSMRSKLLEIFGISHTIKTIVGNSFVRGVSGGERKRVSLAEVLTTNPAVACFDNPSRGLDSSSALAFCRLLKDMSRQTGMANIVTMYQAAESIYEQCFDRVLVLYKGQMIFSGKTGDARNHFINLGYHCGPRQTTPDFLTAVTSKTERTVRDDHVGPVPESPDEFAQAFRHSVFYRELQDEIAAYRSEHASNPTYVNNFKAEVQRVRSSGVSKTAAESHSMPQQIVTSVKRHYQLTWGDRNTLYTLLFLNALNAVITGSAFYMAPKTATGSYERGGAIFFSLIYFFLNALAETPATVLSRSILVKQRKLGLSHPSAYVIGQTIADFPISLFQALVFSGCYYFMLGLGKTASQFFIFSLIVWVHYGATSALFRMIGALAPNLNIALLVAGAAIPPCLTYAGFAPPWPTLHRWGSWIRRISPTPWALEALMGNEFYDITLSCTDTQMAPSGPGYDNLAHQGCTLPGSVKGSPDVPGSTYLSIIYDMSRSNLWRNFGIVVVMWFIYTVVAAVGLAYTAREKGGASGHVFKRGAQTETLPKAANSSDMGIENHDIEKQPNRNAHDVSLAPISSRSSATRVEDNASDYDKEDLAGSPFTFENVNYYVNVSGGEKQLLQNVTAYARPGQLTALMGASGAGKTTLLDTISQRKSEGRVEGTMRLDGQPLDAAFGRCCGFAMQQDVHEPFSTVREALQFSAELRRPADVSHAEKMEYCEYIIKLLELGPIADALIGTPGEGGLGVEERKRVTIAVELACKPSNLLFLDEPTSGLDSQAAYSIMYFLQKVAREGIPIIATIHQPSGVLFEMFDHVLLLAPGGRTIYFGETGINSSKVVEYFDRYGAHMNASENPAEFIISTVSGTENSAAWHANWLNSPEITRVEQTIRSINEKASAAAVHTSTGSGQFAMPLWPQIKAVTKRHWISVWRDGSYNFSRFFKFLWCELFNAFTYFMIKSDVQGMQNNVLAMLIIIQIIPAVAPDLQSMWFSKWAIFEARERNGIYSWKALTTALLTVEVPYMLIGFTIIYFCMYWTIGYANETTVAGYEYLQFLTLSLFTMTWNFLLATLFDNMQTCGLASALFWNILMIFNGTLIPHASLNSFYRNWLFWLDPFRWFMGGSAENLLHPVKVHCSATDIAVFDPPSGQTCAQYTADFLARATGYLVNPDATGDCGYCPYSAGSEYAQTMDFSYRQRWRDWGVFVVFSLVTNVGLIYFVTWFTRVRGRQLRSL
jgi:ATP-binding cassette subfamily G (WHITE) protein 2 (SNQ2)